MKTGKRVQQTKKEEDRQIEKKRAEIYMSHKK